MALVSPRPVLAKRDAVVLGVRDGRGLLRACAAARKKDGSARLPVKALLVLNDLVAEVPLSRARWVVSMRVVASWEVGEDYLTKHSV